MQNFRENDMGSTHSRGDSPPIVLTVAGSDTSGAAGIAADLKTFAACGVHGVFALSLLTAQNSTGIRSAQPVDSPFLQSQLAALLDDFTIVAHKTGLLLSLIHI